VVRDDIVVPGRVDVGVVVCCFGVGNPGQGLNDARWDKGFELEIGDSLPRMHLRRRSGELKRRWKRPKKR